MSTLINPTTGVELDHSPASATLDEADAAIARAHDAFPAWRDVAPGERARLLRAFAAIVDAHLEELAQLEVLNAGHTIGNARWEAGNVRDCLNYYSAAPERLFGRQIPVAGGTDVTFHEPLGVVGIIVPWNFPMPIAAWGFAPALAAGNTVVLKPAELTPLTAIRIGELALEAGLPEGVLTIVPGKGSVVGERFVTHPLVRKVCFTGSTGVGKKIMAGCADQVKRVTLELGGKSANIVFADTDVAAAAASAPYAVFDNAGQDCCARSRILVQRSAYDEFVGRLETAVKAFKVIDPADEQSEMGPMVSAGQRDTVQAYVDAATVAFTGSAPDGPGWWLPPTVVETDRHPRRDLAGGGLRPGRRGDGLRRRGRGDHPRQRLRLRPVRLDLHLRRGTRPPGRPSRRGRQPVGQQPLLGPLLDAVRRLQAVRPRPRARTGRAERVHRGEERLHRPLTRSAGPRFSHCSTGPLERNTGMAGRIEGRTAVVTGGCSGIGLATVRRFVEEGARVVIGDIDDASGEALVAELGADVVTYVHVDVTSKDEVDALFRTAKDTYGSVDIAFNNAGISPPEDDSILDTDLDAWRKVQEVNLTSVYLCCKAALPYMLEQKRGSIINTASFVAVMGAATSQISYSASKGGVLSMSRELGVQFAREGVRVNALCPGPVNTPLLKELFASDAERAARRLVHVPMGRFGEPEEMANAVLFLASDESSFMTANTFLVDGGISGAYVTPI